MALTVLVYTEFVAYQLEIFLCVLFYDLELQLSLSNKFSKQIFLFLYTYTNYCTIKIIFTVLAKLYVYYLMATLGFRIARAIPHFKLDC